MLFALALPVWAAPWRLAPEGLPLRLEVEKTGVLRGKKHQFEFTRYEGRGEFDPADPVHSRIELVVWAGEFRLLDDWVSDKDRQKIAGFTRSKEMLEVEHHPKVVFRSTLIETLGPDRYRVTGQLEIRGVSQPIRLEAGVQKEGAGFLVEGQSRFRMSSFGLKPPSAMLGLIGTKDEMTLTFRVRAVP
jgi:polyisoprenoid-binding protein YceI